MEQLLVRIPDFETLKKNGLIEKSEKENEDHCMLCSELNPCSSNSESIEFTSFFTRKSDATKARNKEIKHLNQSISKAHVDSFVFLNEKLSKIKNMELNCIEVAIA